MEDGKESHMQIQGREQFFQLMSQDLQDVNTLFLVVVSGSSADLS